jgi:hypothetical protein
MRNAVSSQGTTYGLFGWISMGTAAQRNGGGPAAR